MSQDIILGAISGALAFAILTNIRLAYRYHIIRRCKTEDYIVGWKDAMKEIEEKFGWAKTKYDEKER